MRLPSMSHLGKRNGGSARFFVSSFIAISFLAYHSLGASVEEQTCAANDPTCMVVECKDERSECPQWAANNQCEENPDFMLEHCPWSCNTCNNDNDCRDDSPHCPEWASKHHCEDNPDYMLEHCRKSCDCCSWSTGHPDCQDEHPLCKTWASESQCSENPEYMFENCRKSCNTCNKLYELEWGVEQSLLDQAVAVQTVVEETKMYMQTIVQPDPEFANIHDKCRDRHELCAYWASQGECKANPYYMRLNCAPSCQSCILLDFETRCPMEPLDPTTALVNNGDLNKLFERVVTDTSYQQYQPTIHSQPNPNDENLTEGPWVVTLDEFLTPEECQRLVYLFAVEGYESTRVVGDVLFDGTYSSTEHKGHSGSNAWCKSTECLEDPLVQSVLKRIENVTGVPEDNYEHLQLLKYEPGQFHHTHHDFVDHHLTRVEGGRVLSVYLFLNDVEEGGEVSFPALNDLTIAPKKGKALLYPSVLNESPNSKDSRTAQRVLSVGKGIEYGANTMIHQRSFKEPYSRFCH